MTTTAALVAGIGLVCAAAAQAQHPLAYGDPHGGYSTGGRKGAEGWAPPVRVPIYRTPVEYQRYYPAVWYGSPLPQGYSRTTTAPMTYVPTDTMQLGYYWQRVPQWQPRPGMLPPRPFPGQWMMRAHEFGNEPTVVDATKYCWYKKRCMTPRNYIYQHGPAITPHGYGAGYGEVVYPSESSPAAPAELPAPEEADDAPPAPPAPAALKPIPQRAAARQPFLDRE